MRQIKEALLTLFEVVAYGALLLLLPGVLAGFVFGWILTEILAQIMLVAVGGTALLTAIAIREGWYFDHLSEWGLASRRVEPDTRTKPPAAPALPGSEARPG